MIRPLALLAALTSLCPPAAAGGDEPRASYLERALHQARAELDAVVAARPPVPPTPVKVSWQLRRLGAIDAGAPLLALAAADVDGVTQLIALTSREVLIIPLRGGSATIGARLPLPAGPPPQRPRDPVGTLALGSAGNALVVRARSSDLADGVVLAARGGLLVAAGQQADFPLCTGGSATLAAGRNYFVPAPAMWPGPAPADLPLGHFHAVACGRGLVDVRGRPLAALAIAGTDARLLVRTARACATADPSCDAAPMTVTIPNAGTAVAIADVDHDGRPEVITAAAGAPGDPDQITVFTIDGGAARKVVQRPFTGGVVAIAAGDADGDGADEVFAASRLLGSNQVTLWSLD